MSIASRTRYRVWQFWQGLMPRPLSVDEKTSIRALLSDQEYLLFERQNRTTQRHALRVALTLKEAGHVHSELLVAALLHDAGKFRYRVRFWDRAAAVLVKALLPSMYRRWSLGEITWWRRAFIVKEMHAAWGAADARAAGASPIAVSLIARHQVKGASPQQGNELDRLLALLQWADDMS